MLVRCVEGLPLSAWVCVREKKKTTRKQFQTLLSCLTSGHQLPFPPARGGRGIVSELQTPQETRTFCTLWQLVPTWLKDSNIKGSLRPLPEGEQGVPRSSPFPLIRGSCHQQSRRGTTDPAPSKAPFPREGLCNPGLTLPCPLPTPAQKQPSGDT